MCENQARLRQVPPAIRELRPYLGETDIHRSCRMGVQCQGSSKGREWGKKRTHPAGEASWK